MIERIFYTIDEAIVAIGHDKYLLSEMIEFHGLRAYTKFRSVSASHMDTDGFMNDSLKKSGEHELSEWTFFKSKRKDTDDPDDINLKEYHLSGWFELSLGDSMNSIQYDSLENVFPFSYVNGKKLGTFFNLDLSVYSETCRFRVKDIERLVKGSLSNVTADERNIDHPSELQADKALAIMAWMLASKTNYKVGEKPNVSAIVNAMAPLMDVQFGEDDFAKEAFRKRLGRALKYLG